MKYEIAFNAVIHNRQLDLLFKLGWQKKIDYYMNFHMLGFSIAVVGIGAIISNNFALGVVFIGFSLLMLIPYMHHYFKIRKIKKAFEGEKSKTTDSNEIYTFEFTNEEFITRSSTFESSILWTEFTGYMLSNKNIFILHLDNYAQIIGEEEVGTVAFSRIVNFVDARLTALKVKDFDE